MMISMRNLLSATAFAAFVGTCAVSTSMTVGATAYAQNDEDEDRRRRGQTLSTSSARVVGEAFNDINSDQYQAAIDKLNGLLNRELNDFDRSTALELRAAAYVNVDNYTAALRDFSEILRIDALPFDRLKQIRYNVAQLHFQNENYAEAIRFMQEYLSDSENVEDPNAWYILAAANTLRDNYRAALQPARNVLRYSNTPEKKNYDLLNLIYSELGMSSERGELLEQMVEFFPNEESYWSQLSGSYSQAGRDRDAFATLEVAYKAGLVNEEDKIVALAQYYSALDNPYRGAQLIEQEMSAGRVTRNLRNLELLSQLWSMSREQKNAIESLEAAAGMADSGELYYRLGQTFMADEQYQNAVSNLRRALDRGGLTQADRGDIYLLLGSALFNIDSDTAAGRNAARREFQRATQYSNVASQARGWVEYIDAIEATLRAQDEVERLQRQEARRREISRCESIVDVAELGGEVDQASLVECRELLAEVDTDEDEEEEAAPAETEATEEEPTPSEG